MNQAIEARPETLLGQHPTLVERIIGWTHIPYGWASLFIAVFASAPGYVLARYLETGSLEQSIRLFFQGYVPPTFWQIALALFLWTLHTFYTFWMIRYLRLKVVAAEGEIAPLLSQEGNYRQGFRWVANPWPPLGFAVFLLLAFAQFGIRDMLVESNFFQALYHALRLVLITLLYLAYGTVFWAYISALWGLYQLGQQPLRLKPFYQESSMGLRPMAALSLSIAFAYLGFVGILVLLYVFSPVSPQFTITLVILTLVGILMFFLPLNGVHGQMLREKKRWEKALRWRLVAALGLGELSEAENPQTTLDDLRKTLAELKRIVALEAAERKVAAIPTWPFDTGMLRRLGTIASTILIAILTRLILKPLGL